MGLNAVAGPSFRPWRRPRTEASLVRFANVLSPTRTHWLTTFEPMPGSVHINGKFDPCLKFDWRLKLGFCFLLFSEICGKSFFANGALKVHMRVHTGSSTLLLTESHKSVPKL